MSRRALRRSVRWSVAAFALLAVFPDSAPAQAIYAKVGVDFWPEWRLNYGLELRSSIGDGLFVRLEGHGLAFVRTVGGAFLRENPFAAEFGVALHSSSMAGELGSAFALHLAAGLAPDRETSLLLEGSFPMTGDGHNTFVGLAANLAFVAPEPVFITTSRPPPEGRLKRPGLDPDRAAPRPVAPDAPAAAGLTAPSRPS